MPAHERAQRGDESLENTLELEEPSLRNDSLSDSDVAVSLLRNLRLLDLDKLPDWPGITRQTFQDIREARIRQKKRVRDAEWVMYRLVEIWDANEAHNNLDRFFPALEPLQSIKLRSALFQYLSSLKHSGVFARDCALRKSTLDDCKGPRFEELLLSLSVTALWKVSMDFRHSIDTSTASKLATGKQLSSTDASLVEPLILAHRHSLKATLEQRRQFEDQSRGMERFINESGVSVKARKENHANNVTELEQKFREAELDPKALKKYLRRECAGDQDWLNLIISGDNTVGRDMTVEDSFQNVWMNHQSGTSNKRPEYPQSLVNDLQQRVKLQKSRLQSWRDFQSQVSKRNETLIVHRTPSKSPKKTPMKSHKKTNSLSPRKATRLISNIDSPSERAPSMKLAERTTQSRQGAVRASRQLSSVVKGSFDTNLDDSDIALANTTAPSPLLRTTSATGSAMPSPEAQQEQRKKVKAKRALIDLRGKPDFPPSVPLNDRSLDQAGIAPSEPPQTSPTSATSPSNNQTSFSQNLISSVSQPHKHLPTLEQRARQSLSLQNLPRPPPNASESPLEARSQKRSPSPRKTLAQDSSTQFSDLNSRTRQTLANSSQSQTQHSLPHRSKPKHMQYEKQHPVNPWSEENDQAHAIALPEKSYDAGKNETHDRPQTPEKKLAAAAEEVDYESVFKPRHRIRHSPPFGSPVM